MYNAYPVLEVGHEEITKEIFDWLRVFTNLAFVGRSATFSYLHIHDLIRDAFEKVDELAVSTKIV